MGIRAAIRAFGIIALRLECHGVDRPREALHEKAFNR